MAARTGTQRSEGAGKRNLSIQSELETEYEVGTTIAEIR